MDQLASGIAKVQSRGALAGKIIAVYLMLEAVSILIDAGQLAGALDLSAGETVPVAALIFYLTYLAVFIASVVVISMWIHAAHANLFEARLDGLEFTPGWSVGWFFVPIMNLFKPVQAMRELYNRSHGSDDGYNAPSPSDVTTWWACYISGSIAANLSFRLDSGTFGEAQSAALIVSIASSALLVTSAVYLKQIIDTTNKAQSSLLGVAETFA